LTVPAPEANIARVVPAPPLQEPTLGFLLLALALGLIVGSFANVVIHRLPLGQSVVRPRSRCPRCGRPIRAWDNLPVLSYLVLRGRCRDCGARISPRYPLVELTNGLAWLGLALAHGPTPRAGLLMIFTTALLVLALIDYDHHILPNAITLPGIALGLGAAAFPGSHPPLLAAAAAAAAGYLGFWLIATAGRWYYKEDALGKGDWKLAAMLGAWLGGERLLLALVVGSFCGAVFGGALLLMGRATARSHVPLGTFLSLGGLAALFVGEPFVAWYRGLFGA
jgi:leader peptidase (prepilin peptidase)/N-methyltransferase